MFNINQSININSVININKKNKSVSFNNKVHVSNDLSEREHFDGKSYNLEDDDRMEKILDDRVETTLEDRLHDRLEDTLDEPSIVSQHNLSASELENINMKLRLIQQQQQQNKQLLQQSE